MHILISNDDGIQAEGILALANMLAKKHRVTVIAPAEEQSAKSHALTVLHPVRLLKKSEDTANPRLLAVTGTPTDCVKFALSYFLKDDKPDMVISGINHGFNLGSDALYSGTVSAAMEGALYGFPSLALSLEKMTTERVEEILPFIDSFVTYMYEVKKYTGLLNVNFPATGGTTWKDVRVVNQGIQYYEDTIEVRVDPRGETYYWLGGTQHFIHDEEPADVELIHEGYITVVPLTWKQQDVERMQVVQANIEEKQGL